MSDRTQPHEYPEQTRPSGVEIESELTPYSDPTQLHLSKVDTPAAEVVGFASPRSRRRYTPRALLIGSVFGLVISGFLALAGMAGGTLYFQINELIFPGVYVDDLPLGGLNREDAIVLLETSWNEERQLIITDGERTWHTSASDFGLHLDGSATVESALLIGNAESFTENVKAIFYAMMNGYSIDPIAGLDTDQLRAGLAYWAEDINIPAENPTIHVDGGQVIAVPGQPGLLLNIDETFKIIQADPAFVLVDGYLPLVLEVVPPEVTSVENAVASAEALLSTSLVVKLYDPITDEEIEQIVPPETVATWLEFTTAESGVAVTVSPERARTYVEQLDSLLGEERTVNLDDSATRLLTALQAGEPAYLDVIYNPSTYTVQAGDTLIRVSWATGMPYWRILEQNPGLDEDTLDVGQVITIPPRTDLLPLPVVRGKRIVVSITEQRMWIYENGALIHHYIISTGIDRSPTQPGIFQVQTFDEYAYAGVWDLYMPNFIGIYEAWPGFMNGFHGLPTLSSGSILWADVLGQPASYGCIILSLEEAQELWDWAEPGTVVEILP